MILLLDIVVIFIAIVFLMWFSYLMVENKENKIVCLVFVLLLVMFIALMGGVIGVHIWQTF